MDARFAAAVIALVGMSGCSDDASCPSPVDASRGSMDAPPEPVDSAPVGDDVACPTLADAGPPIPADPVVENARTLIEEGREAFR
jgi:hypothetical protein